MIQMQWLMNSKIGPLYLVASEIGLQGVYWDQQKIPLMSSIEPKSILAKATKQLTEFLEGRRKYFDLPLDIQGTVFQKKVWKALSQIPYGKTCSYKDIAIKIKNEKAVRAVGTANGKNPICIIIPCHRVISADGSLGGYSGSLKIKKQLLKIEAFASNHKQN